MQRGQTYWLHGRYMVDEVTFGHVQGNFAIRSALLKHFKIVHHVASWRS